MCLFFAARNAAGWKLDWGNITGPVAPQKNGRKYGIKVGLAVFELGQLNRRRKSCGAKNAHKAQRAAGERDGTCAEKRDGDGVAVAVGVDREREDEKDWVCDLRRLHALRSEGCVSRDSFCVVPSSPSTFRRHRSHPHTMPDHSPRLYSSRLLLVKYT